MSNKDWLTVYLILVLAAGVSFFIAAVSALNPARYWSRLVPLGLLLWVSVSIIGYIRQLR